MNYARCEWCTLLVLKPKSEPLNQYLIDLGFKESGKFYHAQCFKDFITIKGYV